MGREGGHREGRREEMEGKVIEGGSDTKYQWATQEERERHQNEREAGGQAGKQEEVSAGESGGVRHSAFSSFLDGK